MVNSFLRIIEPNCRVKTQFVCVLGLLSRNSSHRPQHWLHGCRCLGSQEFLFHSSLVVTPVPHPITAIHQSSDDIESSTNNNRNEARNSQQCSSCKGPVWVVLLDISGLLPVPSSVGGLVGEHEVDAGRDDKDHEGRRHEPPHDLPVPAWPHPCHVLDIPGKPPVTIDIHDCQEFSEGNEGKSCCSKAVKESEPVFSSSSREDQANGEAGNGDDSNQNGFLDVFQAWLIKQGGNNALKDTNLRSKSEGQ